MSREHTLLKEENVRKTATLSGGIQTYPSNFNFSKIINKFQSSLFNDTSESDISDLKNSVRDFKRNHHMNSNIKNYTCEKNDLCTDDEIESVSTEVQKFITKMSKLKHRLLNFSERNQIFTVNKIFTDDERKTMRKFWEIGEPSDEEKPTRHVNLNWKGTTVVRYSSAN
ncbi:hypothetical protein GLOIN_2v1772943 [Rhizophagus irregularis DAOM 181602=DAOM 197198]|uniref:Uncharacterized protein n=1 Tax=Rhizophagus irregularis (strain DAOM 181602 / DAOM 197198 / MUCL 43194) TaxID=747089 RepID=U9ULZ6_RHIID|nr:hypothetical protein GLOIN_2v1772943 [Rhizophagus irregularis DAOM 181602=DAOM 197198]POG73013.1 hypothetical protein GLOIN_2v1772943 [Rhizophagus irregularis DAOM 181602=DAOM 197198]|eukprot:XP_025179879.1 hypothetical protein GLOIN_2v1772943 [Rhizophagus irregularis DAOM 181602=DAOM 197198]